MKIESLPVKAYRVSDGENFADIVLNLGESSVTVMVLSSFGSFNNHWNQAGKNPLQFLSEMEFEYAMSKFKGDADMVIDQDSLKEDLLGRLLSARRLNSITKKEARYLYDDLSDMLSNRIDSNTSPESAYADLVDLYQDYGDTLIEDTLDLYSIGIPMKYSESCRRFWDELWMPFLKSI